MVSTGADAFALLLVFVQLSAVLNTKARLRYVSVAAPLLRFVCSSQFQHCRRFLSIFRRRIPELYTTVGISVRGYATGEPTAKASEAMLWHLLLQRCLEPTTTYPRVRQTPARAESGELQGPRS